MGKEHELLEAARNGDHVTVNRILGARLKKNNPLASLRRAPGPNTQDSSGYTCLHHASLNGHKKVVEILLEYDANVNLVDAKGSTCLHLAAWTGNIDIVLSILVKSAFQPNVNQQNNDEETPLHCAAQFNHAAVCTLLLQHGADAGIRNFRRESALDLACEYGRFESAEVIIRLRPELLSRDLILLHSPLHLAAKNGHSSVVKMLLNSGFNVNYVTQNGSALHEAAFYGKFEIVAILLNYGIDVHLMNHNGRTVLDLLEELNTSISKKIEQSIRDHLLQAQLEAQNEQQMFEEQQQNSWQCISPPPNYCDNVNPLQENLSSSSPLVRTNSSQLPPISALTPGRQYRTQPATEFPAIEPLPVRRGSRGGYSVPPDSSGLSSPANSEFSYCEFVKPPPQFQPIAIAPTIDNCSISMINNCSTKAPPPPMHFRSSTSIVNDQTYFTLPKQPSCAGVETKPFPALSQSINNSLSNRGIFSRSQDCMLDDELISSSAYSSLQPVEPIYSSAHPSRSIQNQSSFEFEHHPNEPHSLPFIQPTGFTSVASGQQRTSLYTQPGNATSLHNLHSHRPPPPPVKPPRKLSERGLPLEHSRSHHQLHHSVLKESLQPWQPQPVRRSSSNCSDRAIIWNEHRASQHQPLSVSQVLTNQNTPSVSSTTNSVSSNKKDMHGRHGSLPSQPTLRRFMVNCGDVYAQVDKSKKRSTKSSKSQTSKHSRSKSEHMSSEDYGQSDEPIYSTIERQLSGSHLISSGSIDSGKLIKSKSVEKRKKRATISIPLQVRSFDLDIDGNPDSLQQHAIAPPPPPLPPAPSHLDALQQIHQICNKLRQDYKRERRKLCKQTFTDVNEFAEQDWNGRQVQVCLRNIEDKNNWFCCNDASVGTEVDMFEQTEFSPVSFDSEQINGCIGKRVYGQLEQSNEEQNESSQSSTSNNFVHMLRKENTHRHRNSDNDTFNGLYHGALSSRSSLSGNRSVGAGNRLRKSKTTIDSSDLSSKKKFRALHSSAKSGEQQRLHSLIKLLDDDSIEKNTTNGMRLFQFASENHLQEIHSVKNSNGFERNTFPRFLPANTFDEKNEWNDIIRIFDTFEKRLYDGCVPMNLDSMKTEHEEDVGSNQVDNESPLVESTNQTRRKSIGTEKRKLLRKYSRKSCEQISVEFWLASLQLIQYCDVLSNNGFDNLKFMGLNVMDEDDLLEIGIFNKDHRQLLLEAAACLPKLQCYKFYNRKIDHWSVDQWLQSLELTQYACSFRDQGYTDMEKVRRLGPLQLVDLLEMQKLGHRKRVMASLDQRNCLNSSFNLMDEDLDNLDSLSRKLDQLLKEDGQEVQNKSIEPKSPLKQPLNHDLDSNGEHDLSTEETTNSSKEDYNEILKSSLGHTSLLEQECDFARTSSKPLGVDWKHDPFELYKSTCHYVAFYLGSTTIEHLQGLRSSEQSMKQLRQMLTQNQIGKVPAVIISISYKGVRFIDVLNNKIICEHEIRNVHFACQDMDDFKCFAYITKDHSNQNYYCHVFSAFNLEMANEILLTLGQAFEIAYRLGIGETIDSLRKHYIKSKLNKAPPSPPPRCSSYSSSRQSSASHTLSESQFNMALQSKNHPIFRRRDDLDLHRHSLSSTTSVSSSQSGRQKNSGSHTANDSGLNSNDSISGQTFHSGTGHEQIKFLSSRLNDRSFAGREKPAVPQKPAHIQPSNLLNLFKNRDK